MSKPGEQATHLRWLPIFVLILGLLSTLGATYTLAEMSRGRSTLRFATNVAEMRASIEGRIGAQISLLRGVAGLFAASDTVTRDDFRRYVAQLNLREHYPGVQGLGFSARVAPAERAAFLIQAQALGQANFRIWPEGIRDEYHSILFLEPLDRRNQAALGYDMFTEPTRREAMERARDGAEAALSGRVTLVQEIDADKQAGFLIYLPIYRGDGVPASVEQRRAALAGFVYSPFRSDDLFRGIFGDQAVRRIAFAIYDGAAVSPEQLLHRSDQADSLLYTPTHRAVETIEVAGRPWTISYSSLPAFDATGDAYVAPLALVAGTLLSLVLFLLVQAQTIARHEAEVAVQARDSFLSVASHELKTPLTTLLGNVQLLQRRAGGSDRLSEGERRNVGAIADGGRRLAQLVDELLDHARLQEGRLQLELRPLELGALVARVAEEMRPSLSRHTLVVDGAADPLPIIGDATRLDQVILNLIGNAVKYSPAGGPVTVRLAREEQWAVVRVCDQGIGIPDAAMPHLFEQFYRAPNAVVRHIPGMGIGLHVVRELVERHGGAVVVESAEGQGSSFLVRLPLAEDAPPASSPEHQDDPHAQPTRP